MFKEKCIGCGECIGNCPAGAISPDPEQGLITDRKKCVLCVECVKNCYTKSRQVYGTEMTVDEVMRQVEKDMPFYRQSGGGITLSGGEPFMQHKFATEILMRCREAGISTAVETCGHVPTDIFMRMATLVDTYLFDLKHMDPEEHKKLTGVDNRLIHHNFDALLSAGKSVIPRMPLIPSLNDSEDNLRATCDFLKARGIDTINLLPYHELGVNKYEKIGQCYQLSLRTYTREDIRQKKHFIEQNGIHCLVY